MSALRSFQQLNPGTVPGGVVQVPRSYQPDVDRALMEANAREFEFPASSGTFQETQTSQIMIPQAMNRYILGGSLYLQFSLDVTATKATGGTNVAGPNSLVYFSGGPTKSAAALIDRITISSSGGAILADIQNYANWHNLVLAHSSNVGYKHDATILEYAYSGIGMFYKSDTTVTHKVDISLPISIGLFNQVKAFPLWACNGPLVINIVWAPNVNCLGMCDIEEAMFTGTTTLSTVEDVTPAVSVFTITSSDDTFAPKIKVPQLNIYSDEKTGAAPTSFSLKYAGNSLVVRCMCSDVDSEYVAEQRAQMAQGKLLTYHYEDVRSMQTNSGGASINFGINCSSLISVFGLQQMASDRQVLGTVPTNTSYGQDCTGSWGWSQNLVQNIRVFRDGTQLSTFPLLQSGKDDAFAPLQSALGILFSTSNSTQCMRYDGKRVVPGLGDNARYSRQAGDAVIANNLSSSFDLPPAWACTKAGFSAATDKHYGGGSIFAPHAFCWGLSARKCNDADISNPGTAVSQLQVTVDGNVGSGTSNSASVHYIYYVYHASASFDISGNVAVRR